MTGQRRGDLIAKQLAEGLTPQEEAELHAMTTAAEYESLAEQRATLMTLRLDRELSALEAEALEDAEKGMEAIELAQMRSGLAPLRAIAEQARSLAAEVEPLLSGKIRRRNGYADE